MARSNYSLLKKGDVIRTNPEKGLYGIAVVLDEPERIELSPGKLSYPLCHILITPMMFQHEVTLEEIKGEKIKPLVFERSAKRSDGAVVHWKTETCIYIYTNRNKADLPVIGNIDPDGIYDGELPFKPQEDRFFLCGNPDEQLGREALINYTRQDH